VIQKKNIVKANPKAVDFIKSEVAAKKVRHQKLIKSINPNMIKGLQKMKKIEC